MERSTDGIELTHGAGAPCSLHRGPVSTNQRRRRKARNAFFGALLATCIALSTPAHAQIVVTNTADSGGGSLRAAINAANLTTDAVISFNSGLTGAIFLAGPLPTITTGMTIEGPPASAIAIDGQNTYLPMNINATGETITLSGLTIEHGNGGGISVMNGTVALDQCILSANNANGGAGINCNGNTVTLTNCKLVGNNGNAAFGGAGLYCFRGNITLTNCTISGNMLTDLASGAAIRNDQGRVTLTGCTLAGNSTDSGGGNAISNYGGLLTLTNCTLTGNTTIDGPGGAILNANGGTASLTNCTVTNNSSADGGAIYENGGSIVLANCILYGDSPGEVDIAAGTGTAAFCDIQGGVGASGLTDVAGNINTDPMFSPAGLANNGGPTQTIALMAGSPGLGAGTATDAPATDQRGAIRPTPPSIGAFDPAITLHQFGAGLAMFSAPADDSEFTLAQQFDSTVVLAVWDPQQLPTANYIISPSAPADTVRPGQGYWARFTSPTGLLNVGAAPISNAAFTIALSPGWNMIGNPRTTPVTPANLSITNSGQPFSMQGAVGAGLIAGTIYTYQAGDTNYESSPVLSTNLQPYFGYWLFAFKPCSLVFASE